MTKKSSPLPHIAPLQKVAAEPVTDPTELAALDEQRKQRQKKVHTFRRRGTTKPIMTTILQVHDLCRQLAAEDKALLVTRLAAELSLDQQRELVEDLLAQLPADVLQ